MQKAIRKEKTEAEIGPGGSSESEQVRETGEDYLAWFMNRTSYDVMDKMDDLDDTIEKGCSWKVLWFGILWFMVYESYSEFLFYIQKSLFMSHELWVIIYES